MAAENQGMKFRTVFGGGYHKQDVNDYIESMQAQFDSVEETLKSTINRQKELLDAKGNQADSVKALEEMLDSSEQELTDCRIALGDAEADAAKAKEEAEQAQAAAARAKTAAEDAQAEADAARADAEEARKEAASARAEAERYRAEAEEARADAETRTAALTEQLRVSEEEVSELREKVGPSESERAAICAERATAAAERLSAQNEIAALTERTAALEEEMNALRAENEALRAEAEKFRTEASSAEAEESPAPEAPVQPDDYEEISRKAMEYDRLSSQLGAMMIRAQADAEDIRTTANGDAEAIRAKATSDAETMLDGVNQELSAARERAAAFSDDFIQSIGGRIGSINSNCCDDLLLELEDIRTTVGTAMESVRQKYAEIGKKLEYAKAEMESASHDVIYTALAPRALKNQDSPDEGVPSGETQS